ncbi:MAG: hypothetical protein AB7T63_04540 [Planctomycetota bacterium]
MTGRATRWLRGVAAVGAAALLASVAHAEGYGNDSAGVLWRIRTRQGDVLRMGQVVVGEGEARQAPELTDIALSTQHGLYAISFGTLYKVPLEDPEHSTVVGPLGASLNALAFDADDNLYGAGDLGLYRIDLATGRAKRIGAFGVGSGSDGDLVFIGKELWATITSGSGVLLAQLDPATGRATTSRPLRREDGSRVVSVWGLSYDGQQLLGLCPDGEVLSIDREKAVARTLMRTKVRFWGGSIPLRL